MNLFEPLPVNTLPSGGEAIYFESLLTQEEADDYFQRLLVGIPWRSDEVKIFGKLHITKRKVAWFADSDYPYTYSNTTKLALPWTAELAALKKLIEEVSGSGFNSCLVNLYHSGDEGMGWHSDDENTLLPGAAIASMSFGALRRFLFRHKTTKQTIPVWLNHGSLLLMKGDVQKNWLHSLPKSKKVVAPRINLTFRTMKEPAAKSG